MSRASAWDQRDLIVAAARQWVAVGNLKVMHVLTCAKCQERERTENGWCEDAASLGRKQIAAGKALREALDVYDRATVAEPGGRGDQKETT